MRTLSVSGFVSALVVALVLAPPGAVRPAAAQVLTEPAPPSFPNPKKFARGFYAEGELGALVYVGKAGRYASPGVAFGARLGYDITRWLGLQAHVLGGSSDASLPPPTVGQAFQTYLYALEVKLQVQIRRVALFAEGGGAAAQVSNNVLDLVGVTHGNHFSFAAIGGGGIDYHTLNRHFSFGARGDYVFFANFTGAHGIAATAYLRYTR